MQSKSLFWHPSPYFQPPGQSIWSATTDIAFPPYLRRMYCSVTESYDSVVIQVLAVLTDYCRLRRNWIELGSVHKCNNICLRYIFQTRRLVPCLRLFIWRFDYRLIYTALIFFSVFISFLSIKIHQSHPNHIETWLYLNYGLRPQVTA